MLFRSLEQFSLRPCSGGAGEYCGGDGVVRKLLFRDKVVLSVLTERRSTRPYGLKGNFSFMTFDLFYKTLVHQAERNCLRCSHLI